MTAGSNSNINVIFGAQGANHVIAAMQRVRSSAERISTPMVADLQKLRQVAGVMGKIGVATAGIGVAGTAAFVGSLAKAREIAAEVSEQLTQIENNAKGLGSISANNLGGFAFAVRSAGWEGVEDVIGIGGAMREAAMAVKEGDEEVIAAFKGMGIQYSDLFEFDASKGAFSGPLLGADEMLLNIAKRLQEIKGTVSEVSIDESLIKILGATDGAKMQSLAELQASVLDDRIDLWNALMSNPTMDDYAASRAFRESLHANEAAISGMKLAFARELFPVLTESNAKFQQFALDNQGRIEALGGVFADFASDLEPLLLRVAELVLDVAVGGGDLEDTPLTKFVQRALDLITGFKDGLIDVLDYMTTGKTDVPWLESAIAFFQEFRSELLAVVEDLRSFYSVIADDVAPAVSEFVGWIDQMLSALGVESSGGQLAVVAGLVLFSNTLITSIGLVGKLITGLGRLGFAAGSAVLSAGGAGAGAGAAAAGGAAIAATAGAGVALLAGSAWLNKSTADMQEETEQAAEKAKQLAKTHGQAYAAAYLRAFLDQATDTKTGFSAAKWLTEKLGFSDLEGTKAKLDVIIAGGDASEAIAGAAEAFRDFGWEVRRDGQIEISAGITVSALELDAVAQAQLGRMQDTLRIDAAAAGLADRASIPTPDYSAPSDVGAAQQRVPVLIQIGAGQPISGLSADSPDALRQFSRAASQSARARS
jgi:hypothetical protein